MLLWRLARCARLKELTLRGRIGLVLLATNVPVGWGGALACTTMAATYKSRFWGILAGVIYAISWIMLGVGFLLAGKNLVDIMKKRRAIVINAWKRLRNFQNQSS